MSIASLNARAARAGLVLLMLAAAGAIAAPPASAEGTVTVSIAGQGSATGDGINCNQSGGPDCSEFYAEVEEEICFPMGPGKPDRCEIWTYPPLVSFTAGPDGNGFVYDGWTGCDSVSGRSCQLEVSSSTGITARFRDAQAPSASGMTPGSGTQQGTIQLGASASDNAGVTRVEFKVRGALVATDISPPYSASFNTTTVADGAAELRATAFDAAGNTTSTTSNVTIDNNPPTLSISAGPDGQTFGPGTTQAWTFAATDTTLASVQCSVVPTGTAASYGACSGGNGSHSVSGRPHGSYTFSVRARDALSRDTVRTRTFAIDAQEPDTSITSGPAEGSSSTATSATFEFSVDQAGSAVECRVYPAALTPPAFGSCSSATGHSASGFAPGTYAFEVRATDPYGNVESSPAKRTFTVTAPPPTDDGGGDTDGGTTGGGGGTTTGGGGGTTTGGGGGTTTTTGGGGVTTTTTDGGGPALPAFDPRVSSAFRWRGAKTTFSVLSLKGLPKGAKIRIACKGKGCKFKKRTLRYKGSKLNVLKALGRKFRRLKLRSGARLQVTITSGDKQVKVATWKVRRGKGPKISYRCAEPGGKLLRCT